MLGFKDSAQPVAAYYASFFAISSSSISRTVRATMILPVGDWSDIVQVTARP